MRRTLFNLLAWPALLAAGLLPASGLTVAGLQEQLAAGAKITVIDIRSPSAFGQEHIPGAINIPAALCPRKNLPPLGQVALCDDGLGGNAVEAAAAALAKKPGLKVEILEGGFAAWKSAQGLTTRGAGLKRETFNYITYARLKQAKADGIVLFDLRKPARSPAPALTDLNAEFPGMKQARSMDEAKGSGSGAAPLVVLIDNGDGTSEKQARMLKAGGMHSYVILAGGELILARKGQAGLQRNAPIATVAPKKTSAAATPNEMDMEKPILKFKTALAAAVSLLVCWSAGAQVVITNVQTVNVTPSGFSFVAAVSPALPSTTNVTLSIFSDPAWKTNLAGQVGLELYPLNTGDPTATNFYQGLLSRAALRQDSLALGLIYARVSSCAPGTTYYYQISVTNTNGQSAVWPAAGPLPSATTAQQNSFVLQSQQLLITLDDSASPGSIITLFTSNTPSVLAAVVGDGGGPNQVFFNVSDLIAASGDTNFTPAGAQLFTAEVLGSPSSGQTETYSLIFSNIFSVGQSGDVSLGALSSTITLGTAAMLAGNSASVPITLASQGPLVGLSFTLNFPTNLFTAISLEATASALSGVSLTGLSPNSVQLSFAAAPGQNFQGSQQIAQLNFTTAAKDASAFVPLSPQAPQGTNATAGVPIVFSGAPGLAVIIGPQPLLQMQLGESGPNFVLYGIPGQSYQIQSLTNLARPGSWLNFLRVPMTSLSLTVPNLNPTPAAVFFRAYVLGADPPILQAFLSGNNRSLLAYGITGSNYVLQTSSNLSGTVAWYPLLSYTLTNSFQYFTNLGAGSPAFYRIKRP